jgi:hypothetical protein
VQRLGAGVHGDDAGLAEPRVALQTLLAFTAEHASASRGIRYDICLACQGGEVGCRWNDGAAKAATTGAKRLNSLTGADPNFIVRSSLWTIAEHPLRHQTTRQLHR